MAREAIEAWPGAIDEVLAVARRFDRAMVVRETGSTQDVARAACAGRPGLVVVAGRQTGGRGQRGRVWVQHADLGVAATFVVDAGESGHLSRVAGLATLDACESVLRGRGDEEKDRRRWAMGLKSPNDVVVDEGGTRRKLAGVLIEQSDGLALVGIGVNVNQAITDFAGTLSRTAVSLRALGADVARIDVVLGLLASLDRWLGEGAAEVQRAWEAALRPEPEGERAGGRG